jgi:uncharacterized protein YndB with AHSA1/START domain
MPAETNNAEFDRRSMVITRLLSAPCDMAFDAWTRPEVLAKWFGPNGFTITTSKHEFKPGGTWLFVMHGPDGTDYQNIIRYDEIVRPERITYRHGDPDSDGTQDFQTTITFQPLGVRTLITLRAVFASAAIRDKVLAEVNAIEGGRQTLGRLDDLVSASAPEPKNKPFEITRIFNAPRALVFAALTEPGRMKEWLSPKGMSVIKQDMDMRPGGTYHYGLETGTGQQMWGKFFYCEITPPSRLAYINVFSDPDGGITRHPMAPDWPREMLSLTTLEDRGSQTLMTLRWEPVNAGDAEIAAFNAAHAGMRGGWTGTMDQLDAYLASVQSH